MHKICRYFSRENLTTGSCKHTTPQMPLPVKDYTSTRQRINMRNLLERIRTFLLSRIAYMPASVHTLRISAPLEKREGKRIIRFDLIIVSKYLNGYSIGYL